ncbi:MAG: tetratricopeptide repeat protein [Candidatus Cloacimonadota bacterium]|nr:MAG: tetratricopeptide repeat protein [Candidatus Cloacimonadota bacterium]
MKRFIYIATILFLLLSCSEKKTSTVLFKEGKELFNQQKYNEAIAKFTEGIELSPNSAVGYNLIGMAYRFKYNAVRDPSLREKEIDAFKKALECDTMYWVAYINLGSTYYYSGKKKEAVPLFEKALILNPEHHEKEEIEKMIDEGKSVEQGE